MSINSMIGKPQEMKHTGRKSTKPDFFSDALDWKIFRAAKVPGPGAYATQHDYNTMPGGRWGKAEGRTSFDGPRAITPGPGQYEVAKALKAQELGGSGKFNMSQSKTYLEQAVASRKGTPGPAAYTLPDMNKPGGGRFNMSKPKSDVEWTVIRAAALPAPGQYWGKGMESKITGGKFNSSKTKTDIDWAVLRASKIPGPGQYNLDKSAIGQISGGKFNMSKTKTDVEWAIQRGKTMPGPGNYDVVRAEQYLASNKAFSFASRPGPRNLPFPYSEMSYVSSNSPNRSRSAVTSPVNGASPENSKNSLRQTSVEDLKAVQER